MCVHSNKRRNEINVHNFIQMICFFFSGVSPFVKDEFDTSVFATDMPDTKLPPTDNSSDPFAGFYAYFVKFVEQ